MTATDGAVLQERLSVRRSFSWPENYAFPGRLPVSALGSIGQQERFLMKSHQLFCLCLLVVAQASPAFATDWEKTISQMRREGASNQQLAVAYNNYALSLDANKEWTLVERNMRKAMTLDPTNKQYRKNSATACLNRAFDLFRGGETNDRKANTEALGLAKRSLNDQPDSSDAYVLVGDIEYSAQRLDRARLAWKKAQQLQPSSAIQDRLKRLAAESSVEKKLASTGNAYFDLRYQAALSQTQADQLIAALMEARAKIGREFGFWPDRRMIVLVYTREGYAKVRRGPEWSVGVYDGKIRVRYPQEGFRATLVHEYTHAIVHSLARDNCPKWLNEGLAEFQESKVRQPSVELLRVAARSGQLIPLNQLNAALQDPDVQVAALAYQQSFSIVLYLADTSPFYRIKQVLEQLGAGATMESALKSELHTTSAQLEEDWRAWLSDFVR